jgi:hypothetical protein
VLQPLAAHFLDLVLLAHVIEEFAEVLGEEGDRASPPVVLHCPKAGLRALRTMDGAAGSEVMGCDSPRTCSCS